MQTFFEDCYALLGEYNGNWKTCVYDSTDIIWKLKDHNNHEVMISKSKNLLPGKFYLMKYLEFPNIRLYGEGTILIYRKPAAGLSGTKW